MSDKKYKRHLKNFLLFPKIQIIFIISSIIALFVSYLIAVFHTHKAMERITRQVGELAGHHQGAELLQVVSLEREMIFQSLSITFLLFLFFLIPLMILITHRALGPFYRIKMFFKNFDINNPQKIVFREKDYFSDLAQDINHALLKDHSEGERDKEGEQE